MWLQLIYKMDKKYIIIGSMILFHTLGKAQSTQDSLKKKVKKNEIQVAYSHYLQDGNNSAITGGQGTEKLSVYGPSLNYQRSDLKKSIGIQAGADVITSASVDNIDLVSTVSRVDTRAYLNTNLIKTQNEWTISSGLGASLESDYLSFAAKLGLEYKDKNNLASYWMFFQYFNDDLRWGRLNEKVGNKPTTLIYPLELREVDWFDIYKRNSYNLKLGSSFAINKKNLLGLATEFGLQSGLLSTPFHRIFFKDGSLAVENLPNKRTKWSTNAKLNSFVSRSIILRNQVSFFTDNWGIKSFSIENETIIILNNTTRLSPGIRLYRQSASNYFDRKFQHSPDAEFFTSDFDLSQFYAMNLGFGIKYSPLNLKNRKLAFDKITISYNLYLRSDGLSAHVLSSSFLLQNEKIKKNKKAID